MPSTWMGGCCPNPSRHGESDVDQKLYQLAKVVRELLKEEESLSRVASRYGVHPHVITRWREQVLAGLPSLFDDRQIQIMATKEAAWEQERDELYAEIGRLSTQLNWLKKSGGKHGP